MTNNKNSTPKVHLYEKADTARSDLSFLVFYTASGNKYRISIKELKDLIVDSSKLKSLEESLSKHLVDEKAIESIINITDITSLAKPLNILASISIESIIDTLGTIYSDGERLRIRVKKGWKTIKLENE